MYDDDDDGSSGNLNNFFTQRSLAGLMEKL